MEKKEWKKIGDYNYEASINGEIRNIKTGRILKQRIDKDYGYKLVDIQIDKKNKTFKAHRLIAEAFYGKIDLYYQVDHINRVRNDNRLENLRIVTAIVNMENRLFGEITIPVIETILMWHKKGKSIEEINKIINNKKVN